ncbi:CIC11C00000004249 [Sungouiella intermedia]|uniref:CIC11C00000004249 n=1 Tax=Sungouiella intermedia TaxID=45354 RepID=A0A1L0FWB6_9ASCO|nr:CIC11C00000004249 [[Candida] intermedia]
MNNHNNIKKEPQDYSNMRPDAHHDSRQDLRPIPSNAAPTPSLAPPQAPYDQYPYYPPIQMQQGAYYPIMRPGMLPPGVQQMMPLQGQNSVQPMGQGTSRDPTAPTQQQQQQQQQQHNQPQNAGAYPTPGQYEERFKYQSNRQASPGQQHHPLNSTLSSVLEANELAALQGHGMPVLRGQSTPLLNNNVIGPNGSGPAPGVMLTPVNRSAHLALAPAQVQPPTFSQAPTQSKPQSLTPGLSETYIKPIRTASYPRKRSHTACDTCRQKKIKCDNVRPLCGACKRNNNQNCRYCTDEPGSDYSGYDPASINILAKLDVILRQLQGEEELLTSRPTKRRRQAKGVHYFQHCLWDMSLTSVLKWGYLQKVLGTSMDDAIAHSGRLIRAYEASDRSFPFSTSPNARFEACDSVERLLNLEFSTFTNSFLINCHTKVPCVDIITLIESAEIYTLMKRADENFTFISMLEEFSQLKPTERVSKSYKAAISKFNIEDSRIRQRLYRTCCESVPLLLVICAIGALATPIRLDNIGTFALSLEEKNDVSIGCSDLSSGDENIPRKRYQLSQMLVSYAIMISLIFPNSLRPNSIVSVEYHILCSQYYHYIMDPLLAHREIVVASTEMMYFLQKESSGGDSSKLPEYVLNGKRLVVDRLFWTCLKLECELRTELSPHVPLSGITQMVPPSSFMRIPDPLLEDEHLPECIRLANKYDDQYSWFYFLTEIAVRKVDNKLFDEMYSADAAKDLLWDQPKFAENTVWNLMIKYLNQYNGIISSLSPNIRKFVLLEVNVEQIYSIMKKRAGKRQDKYGVEEDIFENLDEFLIDDDLLLRALSESVMFIKTRIVTSKLALFRPLIYLFLEDKILFLEIVEAASAVLPRMQISQTDQVVLQEPVDSPLTGSSSANNDTHDTSSRNNSNFANFLGEETSYFDMSNASHVYLKKFPDDDFSDLIEYTDGCDEFDKNFIRITDMAAARKRILRVLVRNFITLPKLNIPKIGLHRHAGSWYYIRNLFLGVVVQFLLYKKVQESVMKMMAAATETQLKQQVELFETLSDVFSRDAVKASLEHTLLIINYWKEERKDCHIYGEYIQRCLKSL